MHKFFEIKLCAIIVYTNIESLFLYNDVVNYHGMHTICFHYSQSVTKYAYELAKIYLSNLFLLFIFCTYNPLQSSYKFELIYSLFMEGFFFFSDLFAYFVILKSSSLHFFFFFKLKFFFFEKVKSDLN